MKRAWIGALLIALLATGAMAATAEEATLPPAATAGPTGGTAEAVEDASPPDDAFDAGRAGYAGVWVPFEDGFQLYLPAEWRALELTDAQREAGLFYRAGGGGASVAVAYAPANGLSTVDDLEADYRGAGFSDIARLALNGIDAVGFARPEAGYKGVAFFNPIWPDYVMTVYFAPLIEGDAPEGARGRAILRSLSPWAAAPEP